MGIAITGRAFVGFAWMSEHMRVSDVPACTGLIFAAEATCLSISSLYFRFMGKDWRVLYGLALVIVCFAVCLLFI